MSEKKASTNVQTSAASEAAAITQAMKDIQTKKLSFWNDFEVKVPISAFATTLTTKYRQRYLFFRTFTQRILLYQHLV